MTKSKIKELKKENWEIEFDEKLDTWVGNLEQYDIEEIKDLIRLLIQSTRKEVEEEKRITEYKILKIFMMFMRNGHNLERHDLDRIESEWALFEARNYSDLFLKDRDELSKQSIKEK